MHLSDQNALIIFEVARYAFFVTILFRWFRKGLKVRVALVGVLLIMDATSVADMDGIPLIVGVWITGLLAIAYANSLLWDATREFISAGSERRRAVSAASSTFLIVCLALICQYAEVFCVFGLKETTASPIAVTHNIFAALYFTVMTWTTVGYGDLVPSSSAARFFAAVAAMNGYAILALLIAYLIPVLNSSARKSTIVEVFDFEEREPTRQAERGHAMDLDQDTENRS